MCPKEILHRMVKEKLHILETMYAKRYHGSTTKRKLVRTTSMMTVQLVITAPEGLTLKPFRDSHRFSGIWIPDRQKMTTATSVWSWLPWSKSELDITLHQQCCGIHPLSTYNDWQPLKGVCTTMTRRLVIIAAALAFVHDSKASTSSFPGPYSTITVRQDVQHYSNNRPMMQMN